MKQQLTLLLRRAYESAVADGHLVALDQIPSIMIEIPKIQTHGDFSTNLAMTMAAAQKTAPRDIAQTIIDHLEDTDGLLSKTEVAGPGFINFFMAPERWFEGPCGCLFVWR